LKDVEERGEIWLENVWICNSSKINKAQKSSLLVEEVGCKSVNSKNEQVAFVHSWVSISTREQGEKRVKENVPNHSLNKVFFVLNMSNIQ